MKRNERGTFSGSNATHGGKRTGAGRKALGKIRLTIYVLPATANKLKSMQVPIGAAIDTAINPKET
jgi:hypothetical protein